MIQKQAMFERNFGKAHPSVDPAEFDDLFEGYQKIRDVAAPDKWRNPSNLNHREKAARNMPPQ